YHGVLAPSSTLRAAVTPSGRGEGAPRREEAKEGRAAPKAVRMTWMQRLRRVFALEIETCQRCGGKLEGDCKHRGRRAHRADSRASRTAWRRRPSRHTVRTEGAAAALIVLKSRRRRLPPRSV